MRLVVGKYIVEFQPEFVLRVQSEKGVTPCRQHVYVFECDIPIDRKLISGEGCVKRREDKRVFRIANANVTIEKVMHQAAAAAVGFDADAVVRAVDSQIINQHMIHPAAGSAADRHTVAGIEMVVQDRDVRGRSRLA